jgi:hypothetical protein
MRIIAKKTIIDFYTKHAEAKIPYNAIMARIGELLQLVSDETSENDPNYIELMVLTDIVERYEDVNYPILVDESIRQFSDETMCQLID